MPLAVKHVIGRRLDRLPRAALEVLTLAAVLGSDFSLTALEAVAPDREQDELIDVLEAAVAAGLVVEDTEHVDRFSFAHALVRETLYERPIASRRVRLHRRVAEALEFSPLPVHPAELAHHYFEARAVGGADKAILYGLEAGIAAQTTHAYEAAVEHYERVLSILPLVGRDDAGARCDLLLALGAARWQASQPDPRSTFTQALEMARELGSPSRMARAALGAGGRFYAPATTDFAYAELLDEVLADLGPGDSALRVRVLARLAETLALAQPANALELAGEAFGIAQRLADPTMLAAALMGRHAALLHVEHASERRRVGEELLAVAGELADAELGALTRHWLLYDLVELGELDHARAGTPSSSASPPSSSSRSTGTPRWRGVASGRVSRVASTRRSAWPATRSAWPSVPALPTRGRISPRNWWPCGASRGAWTSSCRTIERLARGDSHAAAWRSLVPLAYLDAGDRARAQRRLRLRRGPRDRRAACCGSRPRRSLSEAAVELGDADGAARLHTELAPYAERLIQWSFTGNAGSVRRLLGRTAAVAGRRDDAREHFEAALACHARLEAPALLARTRCDYGEFLLGGTRADRSRAHRHAACRRRRGAPPRHDRRRRASGATRRTDRPIRPAPPPR